MKILNQEFDFIAVKDGNDVVKAADILKEILNINVFSSEESKNKFLQSSKDVCNNFLVAEDDGHWRIQSHYIGDGISTDILAYELMTTFGKCVELSKKLSQ